MKNAGKACRRRVSAAFAVAVVVALSASAACLAYGTDAFVLSPGSASGGADPAPGWEAVSEKYAERLSAYEPGEHGDVLVSVPDPDGFSTKAAWKEYMGHWHDKSWKGEAPASGRCMYAHYEDEDAFEWVAGELIVAMDEGTAEARIKEIAQEVGATVGPKGAARSFCGYRASVLFYEDDDIDSLSEAKRLVGAFPEVAYAVPNIVSASLWATNDTDLSSQDYLNLSRFKSAWDVMRCDGSAKVAVLDSGIDFGHQDLSGNIDDVNAYDAIECERLDDDFVDSLTHGTRVSGIISAEANNALGIAGCSYNAEILPIRVIDTNDSAAIWDIGEGLGYLFDLVDKPDAVNMSFGLTAASWYGVFVDIAYHLLCQGSINELAADYGVVFVAAAGNNGETSNATEYPAALTSVIGVASVDNSKNHAASSTANATVDICAQGHAVYSTKPGGGYESKNGTSFAAPQVAAAAALLRVQHPSWTAYQIESRLKSTAEDLGVPGRDDYYGYGLLDAAAAVGWTPSGSPFTGPSDGEQVTALQVAAQQRLQCTAPNAIPAALARAMEANPDVFAWLYVPGTSVSLPVARRASDDSYYLFHDACGNESPVGCAYASGSASAGLSDAVTAVYGHSFDAGDLAFTSLHLFEDAAFFAEHDEAFVYLPGRRLEYRVVGAYLYTDRCIGELDQSDPDDLAAYFAMLCDEDPSTFVGYKRRVELDPGRDRVLQLSTCTVPADPSLRMVVTCVLVGE